MPTFVFPVPPGIHYQKNEQHKSQNQQDDRPRFRLPKISETPKIHSLIYSTLGKPHPNHDNSDAASTSLSEHVH
jgi:hypothetical protein